MKTGNAPEWIISDKKIINTRHIVQMIKNVLTSTIDIKLDDGCSTSISYSSSDIDNVWKTYQEVFTFGVSAEENQKNQSKI